MILEKTIFARRKSLKCELSEGRGSLTFFGNTPHNSITIALSGAAVIRGSESTVERLKDKNNN